LTCLKSAGADDRVLAQLAGHSDFKSVERYARLGTDLLRSTLRRIK
jgi:site-specific recombinase XerD